MYPQDLLKCRDQNFCTYSRHHDDLEMCMDKCAWTSIFLKTSMGNSDMESMLRSLDVGTFYIQEVLGFQKFLYRLWGSSVNHQFCNLEQVIKSLNAWFLISKVWTGTPLFLKLLEELDEILAVYSLKGGYRVANAVVTIIFGWGNPDPRELRGPSMFWVSLIKQITS